MGSQTEKSSEKQILKYLKHLLKITEQSIHYFPPLSAACSESPWFLVVPPPPGFHIYQKITIWIPESCLLIAIGLVVGGVMHTVKEEPPAVLSSNVFFLYMLPPIVLDSGYFMPTRPFFQNVGTVLWFAVVGTLWNSVGIGLSLFAVCQFQVFGVQDINLQVGQEKVCLKRQRFN